MRHATFITAALRLSVLLSYLVATLFAIDHGWRPFAIITAIWCSIAGAVAFIVTVWDCDNGALQQTGKDV